MLYGAQFNKLHNNPNAVTHYENLLLIDHYKERKNINGSVKEPLNCHLFVNFRPKRGVRTSFFKLWYEQNYVIMR